MSAAVDIREKLFSLRTHWKTLLEDLEAKKKEILHIQDDLKKLEVIRCKRFSELDTLEQKQSNAHSSIEDKFRKTQEYEKSISDCRKLIESFRFQEASRTDAIQKLRDQEVKVVEDTSSIARDNVEAVDRLNDARDMLEQTEKHADKLKLVLNGLFEDKALLSAKSRITTSLCTEIDARVELLQKQVGELTEKLNRANERTSKAEGEAESLRLELADLDEEENEWLRKIQGLRQQLDSMEADA